MSLITHRCTGCRHIDLWRLVALNKERCPLPCCHLCTPGPPEVVPTWDVAGNLVERVSKPGEPSLRQDIRTHDCEACRALYDQLQGAAA